MEADGFHEGVIKPLAKAVGPNVLMAGVDPAIGDVLAEVVQKMPVVMEQAGRHDDRFLASIAGEGGALEGVLLFGDVFAVGEISTLGKSLEDFADHLARIHALDSLQGLICTTSYVLTTPA